MSSNYISLYVKNRRRFEIMLAKLNPFIRKVSRADRALANSYSALKEDAHSIIDVMESHGRRLSEDDFAYYVERLKNIVSFFEREMKTEKDYFSDEKKPTADDKIGQIAAKLAALFAAAPPAELDDEETPLAEDKQDELDEEARAYRKFCEILSTHVEARFEGFPADCVFPKPPTFVFKDWEFQTTPTAKDEANAAADEGAPISEDTPLDRKAKRDLEEYKGWVELSENERQCVLDTLAVYLGLPSAIHEFVSAPKRLQADIFLHEVKRHFNLLSCYENFAEPVSIRYHEGVLRGRIWKVINGVENFRDSQMYNALVKLYPTYKEELQ